MGVQKLLRGGLTALATFGIALGSAIAVSPPADAVVNQCLAVGRTYSTPYFEALDYQGCPKMSYQARWNDNYGNLNYSAVYTRTPAVSGTIYKTANISGTYSQLRGRGCSVTIASGSCTLGAWYSSYGWTNFQ